MPILAFLVQQAFQLYELLIIVRLILSWFQPRTYHPAIRLLYNLTEPVLAPARRLIPPMGGIDFSPIIVFIVLGWVRGVVVRILWMLG